MFSFTDDERAFLIEMRALSTDASGNEVLVGLTLKETVFYMNHSRKFLTAEREHDRLNTIKYLELHEKHEAARLSVLGAEIYLRNESPPRH